MPAARNARGRYCKPCAATAGRYEKAPRGAPFGRILAGSDRRFDPALQRGFRGGADLVRHHLTVLEQEQRRDPAHAQNGGAVGVFVDVDLDDFYLAGQFVGQFFQRRADLTAGAAPFRPEIDDDGDRGIAHLGVKGGIGNSDGGHGFLLKIGLTGR